MKVLSILLFIFTSSFGAVNDTNVVADENTVTASIEYCDGSVLEAAFPLSELATTNFNDSEVIACTYVLSNGDCSTTASTCRAARAGMMACLAALQ